jgi:hypothetical protein
MSPLLDENVLRNAGILAAGIPDRLGEPVERDRGFGFADDLGQLVLLTAAGVHQLLKRLGLLDRIQILRRRFSTRAISA